MTDLSLRCRELIAASIAGCPKAPEAMEASDDLREDLTADSLDAIEMAMSAEEEFGIALTDEAMAEIRTVGDFIAAVEARVVAKGVA